MKAIAHWFSAVLISLTGHAANAQNLGDLAVKPSPVVVQGSIRRSQNLFTYTFTLSDIRIVDVQLTGLSTDANLRLLNSSGTTLASSSNSGVADESLQASLNAVNPPDDYYSIVIEKPGQKRLFYTLTVSALSGEPDFTPQDDVVSGDLSIQDPEFDPLTFHVAWRTNDRLIIAPVNPATGDISLDQAFEYDRGLAVYNDVVNGPEWCLSSAGARVLYTKIIDGSRWQVAQAQFEGGVWTGSLVLGTEDGYKPFGNTNPQDTDPLVKYSLGTRANRNQGKAWKMLDFPDVGAVIPDSLDLEGGRWVPGGGSIMFSKLVAGVYQLANYNIRSGVMTTLTSGPDHKLLPFVLRAPELNNDVVMTVSETDVNVSGSYKWIGVYRKVGRDWTRIKQIFSPSAELPAVHSVEPFVFRGKTYVSFLAIKDPTSGGQRKLGSAVFIASVDPGDDFVREVSAESETMVRSDPEPFSTQQAAFIYYTELENAFRRIHRCATGL